MKLSAVVTVVASIAAHASPQTTNTVRIASGLVHPVAVVAAPGDDTRLYIVEKAGRIRVLRNGVVQPAPMLDLVSNIDEANEGGLLGLAFDPAFASTRYFFVDYVDTQKRVVIARYQTQLGNPELAQPGSGTTLIGPIDAQTISDTHYGGGLQFGPDGLLYAAVGDRTKSASAQSTNALTGKLLRIATDGSIPAGNPFAGSPIWALGLRNPWHFSFDRASGELYIGDVGADAWEEVDRLPAGASGGTNFGWPSTEGPFNPTTFPSFTHPSYWYSSASPYCAVLGGYVYRGCALPFLTGRYVYADFCPTSLWSIDPNGRGAQVPTEHATTAPTGTIELISSLGEDNQGELYLCDILDGEVYKLVPAPLADCNGNWVHDACDIALGTSLDVDGDGVPDECDPCAIVASYCTSGLTAHGCTATISSIGAPSVSSSSGFFLEVDDVEGAKQGLIFYGVSGNNTALWGGGSTSYLCVKAPFQRMPAQTSGGTAGACDGVLSIDWLDFLATHPGALGAPFAPGTNAWAQAWFRDPPSPKTTSLSNGLRFTTCP